VLLAAALLVAGCSGSKNGGAGGGAGDTGGVEAPSNQANQSPGLGINLPDAKDLEELGFVGYLSAVDAAGQGDFNAGWSEITPEQRAEIGIDERVQPFEVNPAECAAAFRFLWAVQNDDPLTKPVAAGRVTYSNDGKYQVSQNQKVLRVVAHRWSSPEVAEQKFEEFADVALRCLSFELTTGEGDFSIKYGDQVLISERQISFLGVGELLQLSGFVGDVTYTVNLKDVEGLGTKGGDLVQWLEGALTREGAV
jgi:hypothetical protein